MLATGRPLIRPEVGYASSDGGISRKERRTAAGAVDIGTAWADSLGGAMSMTTTAGALLVVMALRLALQQSGVTRPTPSLQKATLDLVRKLREVEPDEPIKVVVDSTRKRCTYLRVSTDEVLVEMSLLHMRA